MQRACAHAHTPHARASRYLRCDPEDHFVLLTEPPLNAPEARTHTPRCCVHALCALVAVHNNTPAP
jgi:actin-related protein